MPRTSYVLAFAILVSLAAFAARPLVAAEDAAPQASSAAEKQPAEPAPAKKRAAKPKRSTELPVPGNRFEFAGCEAFIIPPKTPATDGPQPWAFYGPTLRGLPEKATEQLMFEKITDAGVAIAGINVGESYGAPDGREKYAAFYDELVNNRHMAPKPVLLARSRGTLMLAGWASEHPDQVAGLAGVYPVFDLVSYPGLDKAADAYHLTPAELEARLAEFNPTEHLAPLARAKVPLFLLHGDADDVVPLEKNSQLARDRYEALGGPVKLVIIEGQGHNRFPGYFENAEFIDFVIDRAKAGAQPASK